MSQSVQHVPIGCTACSCEMECGKPLQVWQKAAARAVKDARHSGMAGILSGMGLSCARLVYIADQKYNLIEQQRQVFRIRKDGRHDG